MIIIINMENNDLVSKNKKKVQCDSIKTLTTYTVFDFYTIPPEMNHLSSKLTL